MPSKLTTQDFINKSIKIHGIFYDYSQVVYTNMHTKVKIIDPEYGEFLQSPFGHLQGQGHPGQRYIKMAKKRRKSIENFIKEAREIHGDLYDYTKVVYKSCDEKVCIIDPIYGEFWQTPYNHLRSHGCPERTKNKKWEIHLDHIIPLSILRTSNKSLNKWYEDRPLYKFLNSPVNLVPVNAKYNIDKNESVSINGRIVPASSIRNNYELISYLIQTELKIDPVKIINEDTEYIKRYFGF
jgi:hypothetical protein